MELPGLGPGKVRHHLDATRQVILWRGKPDRRIARVDRTIREPLKPRLLTGRVAKDGHKLLNGQTCRDQ